VKEKRENFLCLILFIDTASFNNLDQGGKRIIFEPVFDHLKSKQYFLGGLGSSKN
jgi:hypothetical protein